MKNITGTQLIALLACLVAPIAAFKLLGSIEGAAATYGVGMVLTFLLGRPQDPPSDPPASGGGGKVLPLAGAALLAFVLPGCAAFQQDAKYVLDAGQIACVIANAASSDETVAQVCQVADVLIPDLKKILASQREALAKAKKEAACKKVAK